MGTCTLVEDTKSKVPDGHTLFSEGDCINPTGVYLPPSHAAGPKDTELNVILWLHGHRVETRKDVFGPAAGSVPDDAAHDEAKGTMLRESVLASGKDVVLIAPFLGHHWTAKVPDPAHPGKFLMDPKHPDKFLMAGHGPYTLGKLDKKDGVQAYLKEVLDQIKQFQKSTSKLEIKNLVIACHSGGGDLMRQATRPETGALGNLPLSECWGFDCMYASGNEYGCWADGLPGVFFYFYLAKGSSASAFVDFWRFAYGTPEHPQPPSMIMNNVFLAPAVKGIQTLFDADVFQSVAKIQQKKPSNLYEETRKVVDPLLDNNGKYTQNVQTQLMQHFEVVREVLPLRIKRLSTGSTLAGANVIAQTRLRQEAECKKTR